MTDTPSTAASDDSTMPKPPDVVFISAELCAAFVQLQWAAEYQLLHHRDDTVGLIGKALDAVERASKP